MPRFRDYTRIGIRRMRCSVVGCGNKGHAQWNACADNVGGRQQKRVMCRECDVKINTLVMRFMFGDQAEDRIEAYRRKVLDT